MGLWVNHYSISASHFRPIWVVFIAGQQLGFQVITPVAAWTLGSLCKGPCQQLSPTSSVDILKICCELRGLSVKNLSPRSFEKLSPHIHGQLLSSTGMRLPPHPSVLRSFLLPPLVGFGAFVSCSQAALARSSLASVLISARSDLLILPVFSLHWISFCF